VFPCYVIDGFVTVYSNTKLDEQTREMVRNAIRESIENGNLEDSDNRFLGVLWRGFTGVGDSGGNGGNQNGDNNNGGGDEEGGGGSDNTGGEGNEGDGNVDESSGSPNEGNGEIDRADTTGGGLQPWAWVIIAIGGVLILAMLFLCFRRPRQSVDVAGDSGHVGHEDNASSSKKSSHQSNIDAGEDDESVHDVYIDEYDEARATPLIRNTSSSREQPVSDEHVQEDHSDADNSYDDLKSPEDAHVVSNRSHSSNNSGRYTQQSRYEEESMQEQLLQSNPNDYDLGQHQSPEDLMADPSAMPGSKDNMKQDGNVEETSESYNSSYYEDDVKEEYEIDYGEDSHSHREGSGHQWANEHSDEDDDMANSVDASSFHPP
jgi:hypothetical protein